MALLLPDEVGGVRGAVETRYEAGLSLQQSVPFDVLEIFVLLDFTRTARTQAFFRTLLQKPLYEVTRQKRHVICIRSPL